MVVNVWKLIFCNQELHLSIALPVLLSLLACLHMLPHHQIILSHEYKMLDHYLVHNSLVSCLLNFLFLVDVCVFLLNIHKLLVIHHEQQNVKLYLQIYLNDQFYNLFDWPINSQLLNHHSQQLRKVEFLKTCFGLLVLILF